MLASILIAATLSFVDFETVLTLDPIPESHGALMAAPYDVTLDPDGNIYVLDTAAVTVFYWNAQGKFMGNLGSKGKGPGELTFFAGSGGPHAYVAATPSALFIYEANREITRFDRKGSYETSFPLDVTPGRTNLFKVKSDGGFIVSNSNYGVEPTIVIRNISAEGKPLEDLLQINDTSFKVDQQGEERVWHYFPYSEKPFATYDDLGKQIILGRTNSPMIKILDDKGQLIKEVKLETPRLPFTEDDKTEFMDRRKMNIKHKYFFPDYMPVFTNIIPLANQQMLVFVQSENYRICRGTIVDAQGKSLGSFNLHCGQGGGLFGSRQKIIGIFTDDNQDEDFSIRILKPRL